MPAREDIVKAALGEVGVTERDNKDRVMAYMASVTDDRWKIELQDKAGNPRHLEWGDAWCACAASWIYQAAGHSLIHSHGVGFYGCHRIIEFGAKQDPSAWFDRTYAGKVGDLILFDWQGYEIPADDEDGEIDQKTAQKVVDHVGIIVDVTTRNGESGYITVEGNWGGAVKKLWRPAERQTLLGFVSLFD